MGAPQNSTAETSAIVLPMLHMGTDGQSPAVIHATRVAAFFASMLDSMKVQ
jgi:hypothetical protein